MPSSSCAFGFILFTKGTVYKEEHPWLRVLAIMHHFWLFDWWTTPDWVISLRNMNDTNQFDSFSASYFQLSTFNFQLSTLIDSCSHSFYFYFSVVVVSTCTVVLVRISHATERTVCFSRTRSAKIGAVQRFYDSFLFIFELGGWWCCNTISKWIGCPLLYYWLLYRIYHKQAIACLK